MWFWLHISSSVARNMSTNPFKRKRLTRQLLTRLYKLNKRLKWILESYLFIKLFYVSTMASKLVLYLRCILHYIAKYWFFIQIHMRKIFCLLVFNTIQLIKSQSQLLHSGKINMLYVWRMYRNRVNILKCMLTLTQQVS